MLKMFTTQLSGLLKRIHEKEEFAFEDCSRLLAQAAVSEGTIFFYGTNEMEGVVSEAISGAEPFPHAKKLPDDLSNVTLSDRVLIVTRYSTDSDALTTAKKLQESGIPFVALATKMESPEADLFDLADVSINLYLTKGLLPDETGNRYGLPSSMAALFAYYGVKFTLEEILAEYDEELE